MKNRVLVFLLLVINLPGGYTQEIDSTGRISYTKLEILPVLNPWLHTSNPAGIGLNPDMTPGRINLNWNSQSGDYKRAMEGDKFNKYSFQTERYQRINKTSFYGFFTYDKSYEENVNYTDVDNPYRGTPYILIDSTARNDIYDREFFTIAGKMSVPVGRFLKWGISSDMDVGLSSQDRDPRPRNKVFDLDVSQGLIATTGRLNTGINFLYSYYNEDIEVDIVKENTQVQFLQLLSYDISSFHVARSYNRLYKRMNKGGEFQLNYKSPLFNCLFSFKMLHIVETADDGRKGADASWASIKDDSKLEGTETGFVNVTSFRSKRLIHSFNSRLSNQYYIGSEHNQWQVTDSISAANNWEEFLLEEKYSLKILNSVFSYNLLFLNRNQTRNFSLTAGLSYNLRKQAYYLPDLTENFRNRLVYASIKKNLNFRKQELELGAGLKYKTNLESGFDYDVNSFISQHIIVQDFNFYIENYKAFSLDFRYTARFGGLFNNLYVSGEATFLKTESDKERRILNISTGVLF